MGIFCLISACAKTASGDVLLVVGAAGGVGSMLVQLARELTGMTVIGTASRPETVDWVKRMGADHVIDHRRPMLAQLQALGVGEVSHVASLTHTEEHLAAQGLGHRTQ